MTTPTPAPESNAFKAVVRSVMPYIESTVAGLIAHFGFHATPTVVAGVIAIGGTLLTMLFHALETQFPWVGVFLGSIGAPVYAPSTKLSQDAQIATLESQVAQFQAALDEAKNPSTPSASPPTS